MGKRSNLLGGMMETEPLPKRAERIMRSKAARIKRKVIKNIRETRIMNKWAKRRRERKRKDNV